MSRAARPIRIEALHLADFVHPGESTLAGRAGVVMGYAVVHPDGVVLFDTGIGFGDPDIESAYRPTVRSVVAELRERSIESDDVVAIATSHLHFDHCGQNQAFPGVPIHVQAAEYAAAHEADYTIPGWVDFTGARYELHDGPGELLPGIHLWPSPGHSPGHQAMLVEAADGRTLFAGQAVYTAAEWAGSDDPTVSGLASAPDPTAYRRSRKALRALRPDRVMFGHDLAVVRS
jgi:glyoxylase-like metal-dependent hydrolase (beta-lactamase superfamily II)